MGRAIARLGAVLCQEVRVYETPAPAAQASRLPILCQRFGQGSLNPAYWGTPAPSEGVRSFTSDGAGHDAAQRPSVPIVPLRWRPEPARRLNGDHRQLVYETAVGR